MELCNLFGLLSSNRKRYLASNIRNMKRIIWLFLLSLVTILSFAQSFKGTVTDTDGKPVPYAALYLREMKSGLTTDEYGRFQTKLSAGQYTCEVSSLGFAGQTFSFSISAGDVEKNIVLSEQIYSLREVNVVKGVEDPAYSVMRKAIANAPYYRTQVKGFRAGTYLKGTGKMKTIPAILKLSKEVRKESKEFPDGQNLSYFRQESMDWLERLAFLCV